VDALVPSRRPSQRVRTAVRVLREYL